MSHVRLIAHPSATLYIASRHVRETGARFGPLRRYVLWCRWQCILMATVEVVLLPVEIHGDDIFEHLQMVVLVAEELN